MCSQRTRVHHDYLPLLYFPTALFWRLFRGRWRPRYCRRTPIRWLRLPALRMHVSCPRPPLDGDRWQRPDNSTTSPPPPRPTPIPFAPLCRASGAWLGGASGGHARGTGPLTNTPIRCRLSICVDMSPIIVAPGPAGPCSLHASAPWAHGEGRKGRRAVAYPAGRDRMAASCCRTVCEIAPQAKEQRSTATLQELVPPPSPALSFFPAAAPRSANEPCFVRQRPRSRPGALSPSRGQIYSEVGRNGEGAGTG